MNRIKELRIENGLLQKELAKLLNITQQTCSNYEAGRHEPDGNSLQIMSKLFDVSIDYLLGYSNVRGGGKAIYLNESVSSLFKEVEDMPEAQIQQLILMARFLKTQSEGTKEK